MKKLLVVILFILSLSLSSILGQNAYRYGLQGSLGISRLVAHRTNMQVLVEKNAIQGEFAFNMYTNGNKKHHQHYHYPIYGTALNLIRSGNKEKIGAIYCSYGFISIPITHHKNTPRIKIGLGVAWVEKTFDILNNYQSMAIGSHLNANVVLRIEKDLIINKKHYLYTGLGLDHISNAAFKSPNLGLNFISLRLGYNICIFDNEIDTLSNNNVKIKKNNFQLYFSSAIKENSTPLHDKFIIHELSSQFGFRKGPKSSLLTGADLLYNPSVALFTDHKIQLGGFLGHLLHMDKLKIGFIMGVYIYNKRVKNEPIYHKIFIEHNLNKKINGRITLKSHWAKADFISVGISYMLF